MGNQQISVRGERKETLIGPDRTLSIGASLSFPACLHLRCSGVVHSFLITNVFGQCTKIYHSTMPTTYLPWHPPQRSTPSRLGVEQRQGGPILIHNAHLFSSAHSESCFRQFISTAPSLCTEALYKVTPLQSSIRTILQATRLSTINDLSSSLCVQYVNPRFSLLQWFASTRSCLQQCAI